MGENRGNRERERGEHKMSNQVLICDAIIK